MSIEASRIVIIEDNSQTVVMTKDILEFLGFVVTVVNDMQTALVDIIPYLTELGVTHVLLDANLTPGNKSGNDGRLLAKAIKEQAPSVKIIGFSGEPQDYVDIPMGKRDCNLQTLRRALFPE